MNDEDEDHEGSEEKECVICMDDFWYLQAPPLRLPVIRDQGPKKNSTHHAVDRSVDRAGGRASGATSSSAAASTASPACAATTTCTPHAPKSLFPHFSSFSFLCFFLCVVLVRLVHDGQVLKLTCPNPTCAAPVRASHSNNNNNNNHIYSFN
jgi:hypothetical protein